MIVGLNTDDDDDDDAKRTVYGFMMEPPPRARDIFYNYYADLTKCTRLRCGEFVTTTDRTACTEQQ